jgi:HPt (histidine-containing phosphotransfer) domain-containing protein
MTGDREHGLAAGMDEYVTKPIHLDDLMRAVRKWSEVPVPTAGKPPTFRPEKLLKSLGGDNAALRRLVKIYLDTTPPLMDKLITSQAQGDTAALLHAAHTLKGSLTQLDCRDAAALAAVIEAKARVGDIEGLAPQILELQQRVNQLQASVGGWLGPEPVSV